MLFVKIIPLLIFAHKNQPIKHLKGKMTAKCLTLKPRLYNITNRWNFIYRYLKVSLYG